jgi:hypothetical protein
MNNEFRRMAAIEKRARWRSSSAQAINAAIAIVGITLLLVALACSVSSTRADNTRCLQAFANDQHRTLEAFLQDPALQDWLGSAIDHCSR